MGWSHNYPYSEISLNEFIGRTTKVDVEDNSYRLIELSSPVALPRPLVAVVTDSGYNRLVGVPVLIGLFLWRPSPLLVVMAIMAAPQVMRALRYDRNSPETAAYYSADVETKVTYAVLYLGLAAFLAVMSYDVKNMLGPS